MANFAEEDAQGKKGLLGRIRQGLGKTRSNLKAGLERVVLGKKSIDQELIDDLETTLLLADVGVEATSDIMARLVDRVADLLTPL